MQNLFRRLLRDLQVCHDIKQAYDPLSSLARWHKQKSGARESRIKEEVIWSSWSENMAPNDNPSLFFPSISHFSFLFPAKKSGRSEKTRRKEGGWSIGSMARSSADDLALRRLVEAAIDNSGGKHGGKQKVVLSIRVAKSRGAWGKAGKLGRHMAKPRVLAISSTPIPVPSIASVIVLGPICFQLNLIFSKLPQLWTS